MPRFLQEIASLTNGFLREMVYNLLGRLFLGRDVAKAIFRDPFSPTISHSPWISCHKIWTFGHVACDVFKHSCWSPVCGRDPQLITLGSDPGASGEPHTWEGPEGGESCCHRKEKFGVCFHSGTMVKETWVRHTVIDLVHISCIHVMCLFLMGYDLWSAISICTSFEMIWCVFINHLPYSIY